MKLELIETDLYTEAGTMKELLKEKTMQRIIRDKTPVTQWSANFLTQKNIRLLIF